ncbi:protein TOXD [Aspergillus nomiae NRRL 13137]|uniref:Protein TOXD n=1 Tax=Aspergillus nomiae NRRL (strain ATCC 15546 / NRRL 13137 / CBS 260.88 / M93) TaxID=1509407 RepID=A0A0L1IR63_ASPN3|nr:protein TOXD [Aspergillus nomiae NRRL 13137]KNG81698.1 protein TOXD [Aspergillus nomiae NRRL 13137]
MATTQRAVVVDSPGVAALVHDRAMPKLRDDYMLVKTVAVALNPTDWKHIDNLVLESGPLVGCDYAGIVEEVGPKVTKEFKKGDRVCGMAHGCNVSQHEDGTFAEHIVVKGDLQMKIPENLSFEDAATLGVGLITHRYRRLGIQFTKASGYRVITTCSPHNFDMVRSLGADAVFDYRDPDCGKKIRDYTNDRLAIAWDTISLPASAEVCAAALTTGPHAKYSCLLQVEFPRADIKPTVTLAYTAFNEEFRIKNRVVPVVPGDFDFTKSFIEICRKLLATGKVKVHSPRVNKGIEGVLDGLELLRKDKISGEKLVYVI